MVIQICLAHHGRTGVFQEVDRGLKIFIHEINNHIVLQVLQAKPWGLHAITDFLWGIVTFFQLFFRRFSISDFISQLDCYLLQEECICINPQSD